MNMVEIEIRRDRNSGDGAVSRSSYESIAHFEDVAAEYFVAHLREKKAFIGEGSEISLISRDDIPAELGDSFLRSTSSDFMLCVFQSRSEDKVITSVFDLQTRLGAQYQKYVDERFEDEYYELDRRTWFVGIGTRWVKELFQPGECPEYAEIAACARADFIDPDTLPVAVGDEMGVSGIIPRASLSDFTVQHFTDLLDIYRDVAYPDGNTYDNVGSSLRHYFEMIKDGEGLGLRTGTKYLACAKHLISPDKREDMLTTRMYLNYVIGICGAKLYFREDLTMADTFHARAADYFEEQGIARIAPT